MIRIDREKCTACGACVRDCVVHVLTGGADGFPTVRPGDERYCLNCQHCLAVCPRGAVTCHDVGPGETLVPEPVPDGRSMAAHGLVGLPGEAGASVLGWKLAG